MGKRIVARLIRGAIGAVAVAANRPNWWKTILYNKICTEQVLGSQQESKECDQKSSALSLKNGQIESQVKFVQTHAHNCQWLPCSNRIKCEIFKWNWVTRPKQTSFFSSHIHRSSFGSCSFFSIHICSMRKRISIESICQHILHQFRLENLRCEMFPISIQVKKKKALHSGIN